jgi:streptogramin lyase
MAHWVSETPAGSQVTQANDLFVDAGGIIWVTDRGTGGVAALQPDDELAARMREAAL